MQVKVKGNRESPEIQCLTELENPTFFNLQNRRYKDKCGFKQQSPKIISQLNKVGQACIKDQIEGIAFQGKSDNLKIATIN